jgi:mannose-1-phosphate guanylyltransferase
VVVGDGGAAVKAVVLVGGEGTRMRPLTETTPKPLLPLMDRVCLDHVLDHLARHDVHEVVLSSPYLGTMFDPFIESRHGDPGITWITEREPLGTGGAIVNALEALGSEPFFALNGDILTDLDLTAMAQVHRDRGAGVTIALHHVDDARAFGLVVTEPGGRVLEFREKPEDLMPGDINAGTYLLDPEVLDRWEPGVAASIERDIFPAVIEAGISVCGFGSDAYWLDLGTPEKYLQAHLDLFAGSVAGSSYPSPWISAAAEIHPQANVGRRVAVNDDAQIGPGARVEDSVIHQGAVVGPGAQVFGSILGPGSRVGAGAAVTTSVLGEGASVLEGAVLLDARVGVGDVAPEL